MRAVVQRVLEASVSVEGEAVGRIGPGWLVLLGAGADDTIEDSLYLVDKILNLRAFSDASGKMNLSLRESGGALLVVSQFTLLGDCRKGRRPSFSHAAPPEKAKELYERFVSLCREAGIATQTGRFQAAMQVALVNDGPVTFLLDSRREF